MRHRLALVALLLPLSGCYVAPQAPVYGQPGYGYAQPGYPQPGYPAQPYDPNAGIYPGYSYNDGDPTLYVDGAVMPLVLFGGSWGYYDAQHNWHRAPDAVGRHIEQQRAAGGGFHPGAPQGRAPQGADPYRGGQSSFRPNEPARAAPAAPSYGGQSSFRPAEAARPAPAAAPRPAPAAQPERRRECPPGQRC